MVGVDAPSNPVKTKQTTGFGQDWQAHARAMSTEKTDPAEGGSLLLAIETSGMYGSIALLDLRGESTVVRSAFDLPRDRRSAQTLAPTIQEMLGQQGVTPREVGCVAVASGPGSFTGLRVGIATAKTLAYAVGASLVGVNTLAALAEPRLREGRGPVWAILDAQRSEVFCAQVHDPYSASIETGRMPLEAFAVGLPDDSIVVGPMADRVAAMATSVEAFEDSPQAEAVARIGSAAWLAGRTTDPFALVPFYCRLSAAEEKRSNEEAKQA